TVDRVIRTFFVSGIWIFPIKSRCLLSAVVSGEIEKRLGQKRLTPRNKPKFHKNLRSNFRKFLLISRS
ncbi:hypothetical protein ACIL82_04335, partial [Enterococcus faecium]